MKKLLLLFVVFCLCLSFSGCGAESKLMKQVEEKIFSYDFDRADVDNLEKVESTKAFEKWVKEVAPKISNGKYSEIQISALISNLERAEVYNEEILKAFKKFHGVVEFSEQLKTENVIEILKQLKNNSVYSAVGCDYYKIYRRDSVNPEDIREAAKTQLEGCNFSSGYYDDLANRKEKEPGDDGALLKWKWYYSYKGDFCIEEKCQYNYILGVEISGKDGVPREQSVSYKGAKTSLPAEAIFNAEEIYIDPEAKEFIVYTRTGEIHTSFGVTVN